MVAPTQAPLRRPRTDSAPDENTLVPPVEFYPTNTMEVDWGSGDLLETLSFMGSDNELSVVTSLAINTYDLDASSTEVHDTSYSSRAVLPLSSRHISSSPTSTVGIVAHLHSNAFSLIHPSRAHAIHKPPVTSVNEVVKPPPDFDLVDIFSIEPTEILLPDMNSLEYYTTLLAKENRSLIEVRGKNPSSKHVPHLSIRTTPVITSSPFTIDPGRVSSFNISSFPEESLTDTSGSEPDSSSDDASNDSVMGSEHLLEPSVMPTPYLSLSSFSGGTQTSSTIQMDLVLPSLCPLLSTQPVSSQHPCWLFSQKTSHIPLVPIAPNLSPVLQGWVIRTSFQGPQQQRPLKWRQMNIRPQLAA
ncbi:hypothetical protein Z043-116528 [Arapaima gigas]